MQQAKLTDKENRPVVARSGRGWLGEMDEADQELQTSNYKIIVIGI